MENNGFTDFFLLKGPTLAPGPHPGELATYQTSYARNHNAQSDKIGKNRWLNR